MQLQGVVPSNNPSVYAECTLQKCLDHSCLECFYLLTKTKGVFVSWHTLGCAFLTAVMSCDSSLHCRSSNVCTLDIWHLITAALPKLGTHSRNAWTTYNLAGRPLRGGTARLGPLISGVFCIQLLIAENKRCASWHMLGYAFLATIMPCDSSLISA